MLEHPNTAWNRRRPNWMNVSVDRKLCTSFRAAALLICCSCALRISPTQEMKTEVIDPDIRLELEYCLREKTVRWRTAVSLRQGVDLSKDLPTWPSGYVGFTRSANHREGQGMGGGTSHITCECPEGFCPCEQAIQKGLISGWQLRGESNAHGAAPATFSLRLSVPEGYEILLPQEDVEPERPKANGLQLTFQLTPKATGQEDNCQRIPVRRSTKTFLFPPGRL